MSKKKHTAKKSPAAHATTTGIAAPKPPLLPEKQTLRKKLKNRIAVAKTNLATFGKLALLSATVIFVVSAALTGTDMLLNGRILPRTTFGETNLAFTSKQDARVKIQQILDKYLKTPLSFAVGETQTQITPEELGVQFSIDQNLAYLPTYDLHNDTLLSLLGASLSPHQVTPLLTYDSEKVQHLVEEKLELKNLRAQNATIDFTKKTPIINAEVPGQVISKNQLIAGMNASMQSLRTINFHFELTPEQPNITAQMLEPQKEKLLAMAKNPLTLAHEGRTWKFDTSKHLDALTVAQQPTVVIKNINLTLPLSQATVAPSENLAINAAPTLALKEEKLQDYLQSEIIAKIDHPTSDVKISTNPASPEKIIINGKGQDGIRVSPPTLVASLNLALNNNIKKLQVPAISTPAHVTVSEDLQARGIKNLIATGHSAFAGSHVGRIKNINVGIEKYNGLIVKQGDTFSFNDHLGPVDGEHGFVEELVIKAEGTVPEFGGGLCQVSSTLYRAALFAGFPIVERAAHKYAVSYYAQVLGYGLDATIYPGVHDIRFKNDSPADILIQAYTEGDQAYFKFYGTDDGRKVKLEGPYQGNYIAAGAAQIIEDPKLAPGVKKQVENNHTGFDATWYRYIVKDNQEAKETLFTRYAAIPAKVKVGAAGTDLSTGV